MTAGDQAAAAVEPDDGRSLARSIARYALVAGRRRRAAGDRREYDARVQRVRRAATPDPPSPISAATTGVAYADADDADDVDESAQIASQPDLLPGRVNVGGDAAPDTRTHVRYGAGVDLVERWWNSQFGTLGRRDIWLNSDGNAWHVRARNGGADGDEVHYDYAHEWQARAMVDRLIKAAPSGHWRRTSPTSSPSRTRLVRPPDQQTPTDRNRSSLDNSANRDWLADVGVVVERCRLGDESTGR